MVLSLDLDIVSSLWTKNLPERTLFFFAHKELKLDNCMWKIELKQISKRTVRSVWDANVVVTSTLVYEKKRIYSQAVPIKIF
jgi:hypothetical protein